MQAQIVDKTWFRLTLVKAVYLQGVIARHRNVDFKTTVSHKEMNELKIKSREICCFRQEKPNFIKERSDSIRI